jgi:anti-sigma-K factor RskA
LDIQAYIQNGIIESYVLGLASAEEVIEVEKLRLEYPEVNKAIDEFSALLEKQALENAIPPPMDAKSKILAAIKEDERKAEVPPLLPLKDSDTIISEPVRSLRVWRFAAAASIILFIASSAFNIYLYNRYNEKNTAYQALLTDRNSLQANNQVYQARMQEWQTALDVLHDPKMTMIKLADIKGQRNLATVFWDRNNKDVYVVANVLPKVKAGKQYQLWALVNGKPVDAGMLDPNCIGVCKMKTCPQAEAFAITLENEGGSPAPTMEELYVMGKV